MHTEALIEKTGASSASLPADPRVFVAVGDESQTATAGGSFTGNYSTEIMGTLRGPDGETFESRAKLVTSQCFVYGKKSMTCSLFQPGVLS